MSQDWKSYGTHLLRKDNLDVARVGHVSVDATVGTVRPTAALLRLVDLDVGHVEVLGVERLHLSVALSVGQDVQKVFHRLLGVPGQNIVRPST